MSKGTDEKLKKKKTDQEDLDGKQEQKPEGTAAEGDLKEEACEQGEKAETGGPGAAEDKKEENREEEEEFQTRYLRLAADFQNFRRRTEKEKSDIYAFANEKIMTDLFDVIDNFDRALAGQCTDENFLKGMELIFKQFKGVLEKNGLEEMKAEGEEFDPNFHNAVMMETVEGIESGKVTAVLQKGYMLNKKVIRPAMVKVAQ